MDQETGTGREGIVAKLTSLGAAARRAIPAVLLLALLAAGVAALLFFWNELLKPDEFGAASLPLVAFVAGVAATFNPCSLPALPGFLTFTGAGDQAAGLGRRSGLSLGASLGAMSVVIIFGVIVAFAGEGSKGLIAPYFRWVQLGVGLALIGLAAVHLMGQTERLPLVGRIMSVGSHMWDEAMGRPTPRGSYLFGAGFVAVGAGWTVPFLAAVAVFATGVGGFFVGFGAFLIFAITMGLLVFMLAFLGSTSGPALTRSLRVWGRRIQVVTALIIVLVGAALVYSGVNPGVFDRLILTS